MGTAKTLMLALGLCTLLAGIILGFTPIHTDFGARCGNATGMSAGVTWSHQGACEGAISARRTLALALAIPGFALAMAGALTGDQTQPTRDPSPRPNPEG